MDRMKTILVTGAAGFIGSNLCLKLFEKSENVKINVQKSVTLEMG